VLGNLLQASKLKSRRIIQTSEDTQYNSKYLYTNFCAVLGLIEKNLSLFILLRLTSSLQAGSISGCFKN